MRVSTLLGVGASVALVLLALIVLVGRAPPDPGHHVEAPAEPKAAAPTMRDRIAREAERSLPQLRGEDDVRAYLDRLEQRARARGYATAEDVEPGTMAIQTLEHSVDPQTLAAIHDDFDETMRGLAAVEGAPLQPLPSLDESLVTIRDAASDDERREAVQHAVGAIAELGDDPVRQAEAEARLDAVLGR